MIVGILPPPGPIDDTCDAVEISRVGNYVRIVFWQQDGDQLVPFDERCTSQFASWQLIERSNHSYELVCEDWGDYSCLTAFRRVRFRHLLRTTATPEQAAEEEIAWPPPERRRLLEPKLPGQAPYDLGADYWEG